MRKAFILICLFAIAGSVSYAQSDNEVKVPKFADKYSETVQQLEDGKTDINYRDFRESFLESEQFKIASVKHTELDKLEEEMYTGMKNKDYNGLITITKKMLSIDYTNMMAHKILRQTYTNVGDTVNAAKYKTIQFGLLNSIVRSGDGKTCATAWPVIQVEEEYFILRMVGAEVTKQSTYSTGGFCDKMEVKESGASKTYYFEITKVFEGYKKLGLK